MAHNKGPVLISKAFVLMPFDSEFDTVYNDIIKPSLEEIGYDVKRADSMLDQRNILKDIVRGIKEADLIIADLTSLNANVFYELGIAHAMRKQTVLLRQNNEDIPFDLMSYRVISYSTHFKEAPLLIDKLKEIGKKAKIGNLEFGNPITDFLSQSKDIGFLPQEKDSKFEHYLAVEKDVNVFLENISKSTDEIEECSDKLLEASLEMQKNMQARSVEVKTLGKSNLLLGKSKDQVTNKIAINMLQYAKRLEGVQPKLHKAWDSYYENTSDFIINIGNPVGKIQVFISDVHSKIVNFQILIRKSIEGLQNYKESTLDMAGISIDIDRAIGRITRVLDLLISDYEVSDSYCTRILTLIDEKIKKKI